MDAQTSVTKASAVVIPCEHVKLSHLKTLDGQPVVVRCHVVDELVIAEVLKTWPGAAPRVAGAVRTPEDEQRDVRFFSELAPALLPLGTSLDSDDGPVRPAFYFPGTERHADSLPGDVLRVGDKVDLVMGILRASGYIGGEAEAASFSGKDGERTADGAGTVEAGVGVGADPVGGAA